MPTLRQEQYLWASLCLLVLGVFVLGICDPALRPQVMDFAKIALGGILGLLTARAVPPKVIDLSNPAQWNLVFRRDLVAGNTRISTQTFVTNARQIFVGIMELGFLALG